MKCNNHRNQDIVQAEPIEIGLSSLCKWAGTPHHHLPAQVHFLLLSDHCFLCTSKFYSCFLHGEPNRVVGSYFVILEIEMSAVDLFVLRGGQKKDFSGGYRKFKSSGLVYNWFTNLRIVKTKCHPLFVWHYSLPNLLLYSQQWYRSKSTFLFQVKKIIK